jgi:tRNA G18 (ribose-2'-O)-methylase SpoU
VASEAAHGRDRTPEEGPRLASAMPLVAVLDNIRSAFNVGSIFRTSEAVRLEHLHLCGITPYPPNEKLDHTALGTAHRVSWTHHLDARAVVRDLRASGRAVWGVELGPSSRSLFELRAPSPLALVFGHETAGVDPHVLAACDAVVAIPMRGRKNSLNVATAYGIVVFEILRQWELGGWSGLRPGAHAEPKLERPAENQDPRIQEKRSSEPKR